MTKAHLPFNDNTTMITYNVDFDKSNMVDIQKNYDIFTENLNYSSLKCAKTDCGAIGCCTIHAYYERSLITPEEKIILLVLRVMCGKCNATHAILPSFIVPYSQVPLKEHVDIIERYEEGGSVSEIADIRSNPEICVTKIQYIIKQYKLHWKQRLLSLACAATDPISKLVKSCFGCFFRQFMQIKSTPNILYFLNI